MSLRLIRRALHRRWDGSGTTADQQEGVPRRLEVFKSITIMIVDLHARDRRFVSILGERDR